MAMVFDEAAIPRRPFKPGIVQQPLLPEEHARATGVRISRLTMSAGASLQFEPAAGSLMWAVMLQGEATLAALYTEQLSDAHSFLLPAGFRAVLSTAKDASLLHIEVPDAGKLDPDLISKPPQFAVINWAREPVFESKADARKRVFMLAPYMCDTKAIRADMVIFQPRSASPLCRHRGASVLIYVVSGSGEASSQQDSYRLRPGSLIVFPDGEPHRLKAAGAEMRFIELYVPGVFEILWDDPAKATVWTSTDRDIGGNETERDAKERVIYGHVFGNPFTR